MAIADDDLPTHEAIGRARLRMQSRQWLAGKYNQTYAEKPNQTQVKVGVQVVLPEAERQKLIERRGPGAASQPEQRRSLYAATARAVDTMLYFVKRSRRKIVCQLFVHFYTFDHKCERTKL
jgi:hypothetical protein